MTKQSMVDEENADEMKERADEVIIMSYDVKLFY